MAQTSQETFNIECNCWKEKITMSKLTSLHLTQKKAFRLHIHKTGSLRLQVATDIELDKNGEGRR